MWGWSPSSCPAERWVATSRCFATFALGSTWTLKRGRRFSSSEAGWRFPHEPPGATWVRGWLLPPHRSPCSAGSEQPWRGAKGAIGRVDLVQLEISLRAGRKILMAGKYLIGVDLGTSGTEGGLRGGGAPAPRLAGARPSGGACVLTCLGDPFHRAVIACPIPPCPLLAYVAGTM